MNYFDLLMAGNAIVLAAALYQLRPATLLFAGNNMLVARALAGFERYGAPRSMRFLPIYVFSQENLDKAAVIMGISLAFLAAVTLIPRRGGVRIPPDTPAVPKAVLVLVGIYLLAFMVSRATIFSGGYAGGATVRFKLELAGEHVLMLSLLMYELARRRLLGLITARKAMLIMGVVGLIQYSQGVTGITTGYMFVSAVLLLPRTGGATRIKNMARVAAVMLAVLALAFVVRGTRTMLHREGAGAVEAFVQGALESEQSREESSEGAESTANAGQSATHMLMCTTLYETGLSREWRSIIDVVEYTLKPSIFERLFDWRRSENATVELYRHFIHGGGINVLGELYWNGGYLCVLIMTAVITLFCFVVDTRYRASPFWLMIMSQFAPSFLMGYGYGFAQIARGASNGLLVVVTYKIVSSALRRDTAEPAATESARP